MQFLFCFYFAIELLNLYNLIYRIILPFPVSQIKWITETKNSWSITFKSEYKNTVQSIKQNSPIAKSYCKLNNFVISTVKIL